MSTMHTEIITGHPGHQVTWKVLLTLFILFLITTPLSKADKTPYDWALVRLDYARQDKVAQLQHFCNRMHSIARGVREDSIMINCFLINHEYNRLKKKETLPTELTDKVTELRMSLNDHYLSNYLAFYDILFVNNSGEVFYTIRNESDLHRNLLDNECPECPLESTLKKMPDHEVFVDFFDYGPSSEPASFFIEPVHKNQKLIGWIILQCAINKVNSLFAWTEDLGQTGETFLVNQQGYMLSESNFEGASTILARKLHDRNVQGKFAEGQGHRQVLDYRGFIALTSFEVVPFLNTQWLVVAKVDKDEVLTDHFGRHRRYCAEKVLDYLSTTPAITSSGVPPASITENQQRTRVDIDEFLKADHDICLQTFGVATCTGLLAVYPEKFAYLAHISPRDKVYGSDGANLLGQMIKKMKSFDMYPNEQRKVVFTVIAPHLESLVPIVNKIVDEGFLLSQIQVMYNGEAQSATIAYSYPHDDLAVYWKMKEKGTPPIINDISNAVNLGTLIEEVLKLPPPSFHSKINTKTPRITATNKNYRKEYDIQ